MSVLCVSSVGKKAAQVKNEWLGRENAHILCLTFRFRGLVLMHIVRVQMNVLRETLLVHASVVLLSPVPLGAIGRMFYFADLKGVLDQKFISPLSTSNPLRNLVGKHVVEGDAVMCLLPANWKANCAEYKNYKASKDYLSVIMMGSLVGLR